MPLYRLLDRLSMVTVGKIFARQGKIHLCFRLQLKITDLMFNLNINKNTAPCRYFCRRRAVLLFCSRPFIQPHIGERRTFIIPTIYLVAYWKATNILL